MSIELQAAIKISIQNYFNGRDPLPQGRKYTKAYLDNFHKKIINPDEASKSNKKVKDQLATPNDVPAPIDDSSTNNSQAAAMPQLGQ